MEKMDKGRAFPGEAQKWPVQCYLPISSQEEFLQVPGILRNCLGTSQINELVIGKHTHGYGLIKMLL